jgi:hypothetical protein
VTSAMPSPSRSKRKLSAMAGSLRCSVRNRARRSGA